MESKTINKNNDLKSNNSLILKIVIGVCVALVITIICLIFFMNKGNSNDNNNSNSQMNSNSNNINNAIKGNTIEELKTNSKSDIESLTNELENEWNSISQKITTFEQYKNNRDKIDDFYDKIVKSSNDFTIKIREYALKYAEIIINSDRTISSKYDDMEDLYDDIYDGIAEDLYDDIYDGLLEEMYDYYYDGILDDAYDNVPYSDYSDMRSHEYKNYSNSRSDVYKAYSNTRSDIYKFYSKLRSKLYSKDLDKAKEEIDDFNKDIERLKNK